MTTTWFILARAVHFGACLLFFGIFAFDRFVATAISSNGKTEIGNYWQNANPLFSLILLPVILLSGIAWFALVAMTMSGQPLQTEILKTVWTQTQFGTVWKLRLIFWLAAATTRILFYFSKSTNGVSKILNLASIDFQRCFTWQSRLGRTWAGNFHLAFGRGHFAFACRRILAGRLAAICVAFAKIAPNFRAARTGLQLPRSCAVFQL